MANEKRLIDTDVLLARFEEEYRQSTYPYFHMDEIADEIIKSPTVEAVEVVHGRWDEIPNKYMSVSTKNGSYSGHATSCSVCHEVNPNLFKTNYCPNCGAKMDGDGNG